MCCSVALVYQLLDSATPVKPLAGKEAPCHQECGPIWPTSIKHIPIKRKYGKVLGDFQRRAKLASALKLSRMVLSLYFSKRWSNSLKSFGTLPTPDLGTPEVVGYEVTITHPSTSATLTFVEFGSLNSFFPRPALQQGPLKQTGHRSFLSGYCDKIL